MTPEEELAKREAQLAAREDRPGFEANCKALRARIDELREELKPPKPPPGQAKKGSA